MKSVELEVVTVRAAGRAGSAIADLFEIGRSLLATPSKFGDRRHILRQRSQADGQIVCNPMHPGLSRRIRIVAD